MRKFWNLDVFSPVWLGLLGVLPLIGVLPPATAAAESLGEVRQLTHSATGHLLTNFNVWSPDGQWIVYDVRADSNGTVFNGDRIEKVNALTGDVKVLFRMRNGANVGVATYSPTDNKVVFIEGPENPSPDWQYSFTRRHGLIVDEEFPNRPYHLDACDLSEPLTPGALRGGSHVHVFSPDGKWISFTYQDILLEKFKTQTPEHDTDLRNIGVSVPAGAVIVDQDHPRNFSGTYFTVLVTQTTAYPRPGSDEICKAYEDAWIGTRGYVKADGTRQDRALACLGDVVTINKTKITELYVIDLPHDLTMAGDKPLEGTMTTRPAPPQGVSTRRLTHTADRKYPGLQGPRHWPRSSPDGTRIAFLMKDDAGVVQLWTISPNGGEPRQVTHNPWDVASTFSWSPDGRYICHVMDNSMFVTEAATGKSIRVTPRYDDKTAPVPHVAMFSPNGQSIAFVREMPQADGKAFSQIFVVELKPEISRSASAQAN